MQEIQVPARKMTIQEYLERSEEDNWTEWVNGEVVRVSPASKRHQQLLDFLATTIKIFAEEHHLGRVLIAPFAMRLEAAQSAREPDLLFVAGDREHLLKDTYLDGPADLVIEIVSPESRLRDRGEKFAEYELGGVREYWLLDPMETRADFYLLGADGRYERIRPDAEGTYHSPVLANFPLQMSWLWQEPLPKVLDVLRELKLI